MNNRKRSLFVDEQDQLSNTLLRTTPMAPKVILAGLGTTLLSHLILPLIVLAIGAISHDSDSHQNDEAPIVEELR